MEIKWSNIFGLILLIFCIYLFFKTGPCVTRFFESMSTNYCFYAETPTMKVMLIGLICVTIVAVTKMIINR